MELPDELEQSHFRWRARFSASNAARTYVQPPNPSLHKAQMKPLQPFTANDRQLHGPAFFRSSRLWGCLGVMQQTGLRSGKRNLTDNVNSRGATGSEGCCWTPSSAVASADRGSELPSAALRLGLLQRSRMLSGVLRFLVGVKTVEACFLGIPEIKAFKSSSSCRQGSHEGSMT